MGSAGRLIVCERRPRLMRGMCAAIGGRTNALHETRTFEDAWTALATWPHSLLVAEFTGEKAAELVGRQIRLAEEFPHCRAVWLVEDADQPWEIALREAGALLVLRPPIDYRALWRLAERQLDRAPHDVTAPPNGWSPAELTEYWRVQAGLPPR